MLPLTTVMQKMMARRVILANCCLDLIGVTLIKRALARKRLRDAQAIMWHNVRKNGYLKNVKKKKK